MKKVLYFFLVLFTTTAVAQIPSGYYDSAEGKSGEELKAALNDIIDGHTEYTYTSSSTDTWDILKEADRDPNNSNNVVGIYSGFSMNGAAEFNSGDGWNREHIWPQSRGDFGTSRGTGTDCHNLRAADISTNSARSNRNFDESDNPYVDNSGTHQGATGSFTSSSAFTWEPRAEVKGDVARMIFYMATRYEGENGEPDLELTEELLSQSSKDPMHAKLSVLLTWHEEDPVSQAEIDRNEVIYGYQNNRNPFIDHPEYVQCIWASNCGDEPTPVLEVSVASIPDFGSIITGQQSDVKSYVIRSNNLTDNISITAPDHFLVSKDNQQFSDAIDFTIEEANGNEIFVNVIFSPTSEAAGAKSGNVVNISGDLSASVMVSGTEEINAITSLANEIESGAHIYPNPASTHITSSTDKGFYKIIGVRGEVLFEGKVSQQPISIEMLNPGVYIFQHTNNLRTSSTRLIIE